MFTSSLALALATAAHAQDAGLWHDDFPVVSNAPTDRDSVTLMKVYGPVAAGHPDQVIASDWPHVSCHVREGTLSAVFEAETHDWPESWPSEVRCQASGHALVLTLTPRDLPLAPEGPIVVDLAEGIVVEQATDIFLMQVYALPGELRPRQGKRPARTDEGARWRGVSCVHTVNARGEPLLHLWVDHAEPGSGWCPAEGVTGAHRIPLRLEP